MNELLLREICELSGVTRRAVQGYEKIGLVASSSKNKMGYLLYNEQALNKIKEIKQYQECGFSLKEIKSLELISNNEKELLLKEKVSHLKDKYENIQSLLLFLEKQLKKL